MPKAAASSGPARTFDIVIFGATSFTGIWSLEHLATNRNSTLKGLKIALAGRNQKKVQECAEKVGLSTKEYPVIVASSDDNDSLDAMCKQTKVVLSFVGPYNLYGMPLVEAGVRNGTSILDITGEFNYVARTVERFHQEAKEKQMWLLSCCAFDSLPVELSNMLVHRIAKEKGLRIDHVRAAWSMKKGTGASGGTLHSAVGIAKFIKKRDWKPLSMLGEQDKIPADLVPYCNPPGGFPEQKFINASKDFQGYLAPFIMGGVNQKVVRKSNALLGVSASYVECARTTSFIAAIIYTLVPYMMILLFLPVIGTLIKNYLLPKPGEGPSREVEAKAKFDVLAAGYTSASGAGSPALRVKMDVPVGFGGYRISGLLGLETAAAVALEELNAEAVKEGSSWYRGGAVTPGAVVGDALIKRLAKCNINFYSTTEQTFKSSDMQLVQ